MGAREDGAALAPVYLTCCKGFVRLGYRDALSSTTYLTHMGAVIVVPLTYIYRREVGSVLEPDWVSQLLTLQLALTELEGLISCCVSKHEKIRLAAMEQCELSWLQSQT
jgi:hypothetical protein